MNRCEGVGHVDLSKPKAKLKVMSETVSCKCVLVGGTQIGKTAWLRRIQKLFVDPAPIYTPTMGSKITSIDWKGLRFDIWECGNSKEELPGYVDVAYIKADIILIMTPCSPGAKGYGRYVRHWLSQVRSVADASTPYFTLMPNETLDTVLTRVVVGEL